jgi:hypothetical protein
MFANELNQVVREAATLPPPGAAAAVPNVQVLNSMVGALRGHRLGDPVPWVNGVIFPALMESLHPNFCGHRAMAAEAQKVIVGGNPPAIGKCF